MNQAARALIGERVKSLDRLFFTNVPLSGQVQSLKTNSGIIKVNVDVQRLQGDRSQVFVTPIVDEKKTETKALKDLPIPLLFIDEGGQIDVANTAALNLLGYADLSGHTLSDVFDSQGVMI
jgi:two-component system cell cycle sensor histidine kinase/response regulator CckA